MDKLRIFNIALEVYNRPPLTEEQLDDKEAMKAHPEIMTLETLLPVALDEAKRAWHWSFLDTELELGEDQGPKEGYTHSYRLPEGLFRLTRADGIYKRVGNMLLTNGRPLAYGQMAGVPDSGVPEDFDHLVAYALAMFAAPRLSSGDQKAQYASEFYQTLLTRMRLNDTQDERREDWEVANGCGSYV